ncbi:MAG: prolyl oligopeptidase family serine peptidase [Candidatus Woesearchaeota archaeon]
MRPNFHVFNINGIRLLMWFREDLDPNKEYRFIISCHGLPSHPYQHNPAKMEIVTDAGFVMIFPDYIGTWASDGTMSWENCAKTILDAVDFVKSGQGKKVTQYADDEPIIKWKVKDITLLGGSFGGSVALVAGAKSDDVKNIISIGAPTNWRDHSRIPEESAEPIEDLYYAIKNGWKNLWRIPDKKEWDRLVKGTADLNPVDYIEQLKSKNTLLIHGGADETVSVKRAEQLHQDIRDGKGRHEIMILKDEGHKGNDTIGREEIFSKVKRFLS